MPPQVRVGDAGTPVGPQTPVQIEQSKTAEIEKTSAQDPPKQTPETAAKNAEAAKQHATGTKYQETSRAQLVKHQLDQKLTEKNAGKADQTPSSAMSKEEAIALAKKANDDVMQGIKHAKAIEVTKKVTDVAMNAVKDAQVELVRKTNVQVIQTSLEVSDTKNLKKMIADSEKWPEGNKKIFNEAMGHSEVVMKKVAKEFTPEEQLKVINRSYETDSEGPEADKKHETALKTWMENTKSSTLNHVVSNADNHVGYEIQKQVQDNDVGNFNRLNSANKVHVAQILIRNPDSHDLAIQNTFDNINAKEKNMLIDNIQVKSPNSQLTFIKLSSRSLDADFMEGINKNNGEFMRKTYAHMAENAKTPEEKDRYNNNAMYLENWMDEKFKK